MKILQSCNAVALSLACILFSSAALAESTTIHAGDRLSVDVYNHPDVSSTSAVDASGNFPMPVAGVVSVSGLTPEAAGERIQSKLLAYFRHPAVRVRVVQQGDTVFFSGFSVGSLTFAPGMTLASAIGSISKAPAAQAGQTQSSTQTAPFSPSSTAAIDFRKVGLKRSGKVVGFYNIESLGRQGASGPTIEPGDNIMLRAKPVRVDVLGDVKNPGPQYVYNGETLTQAVDEAGGFSTTTSTSNIELSRAGATQSVSSASVAMSEPARDGDVLNLAPAPRVTVLGMVTTPGEVVLKGDTTLLSSLYAVGGPNKYANLKYIRVVDRNTGTHTYDVTGLTHGDLSANIPLQDGDVVYVPEGHKIDPLPFFEALGAVGNLRGF